MSWMKLIPSWKWKETKYSKISKIVINIRRYDTFVTDTSCYKKKKFYLILSLIAPQCVIAVKSVKIEKKNQQKVPNYDLFENICNTVFQVCIFALLLASGQGIVI